MHPLHETLFEIVEAYLYGYTVRLKEPSGALKLCGEISKILQLENPGSAIVIC